MSDFESNQGVNGNAQPTVSATIGPPKGKSKKSKKHKTKSKLKGKGARESKRQSAKAGAERQIPSADLPRKTLEDALRVARAIKDEYAGKLATWEDIAKALAFSPTNPNNKYLLWAATAYGLIEKDENDQYRLTEIARKILGKRTRANAARESSSPSQSPPSSDGSLATTEGHFYLPERFFAMC